MGWIKIKTTQRARLWLSCVRSAWHRKAGRRVQTGLTKSLPLGTDGCLGGNKKGKWRALWETDPAPPTHTNTPLQRAHGLLPHSTMPLAKTGQDAAKNVIVLEKQIRGFSPPNLAISKVNQSKNKTLTFTKGRFAKLSVGLPAFVQS